MACDLLASGEGGGTRRGSQVVPFPWYPALQVHVAGDGVELHTELAEHHAHGSAGTGGPNAFNPTAGK